MGRTFLFAIGGTGARVLRSLIMILASGYDIKQQEIIPLCVDLDDHNGDLERVLKLLRTYRDLKDEIPNRNKFFNNRLGTLGSLTSNSADKVDGISDNFKLNFGNIYDSFFSYIQGERLDEIDQTLFELLYDDSPSTNPYTELNLTLDKGFKGNPNIGCVVFNDIINTPEYKYFENVFTQDDKIFIISSIFGGTGSSGFPQLVENIKSSNNNHIANAPLGSLIVKPYFKVHQDEKSTIDSELFNSKTKAALSYYKNNLHGLSNIYYIGDKATEPYDNIMGGENQKNKAHIVEFLGAKSICHFLGQASYSTDTRYYEFGLQEMPNDRIVKREHFYCKSDASFWEDFSKYALLCKLHNEISANYNQFSTFFKEIGLSSNDLGQMKNLSYFSNAFLTWTKELKQNNASLALFNVNDDMQNFAYHHFYFKTDTI